MSVKPGKYCVVFPCRNRATPGSSYCPTHQPPRAPKQADEFYLSVAWRRFRWWYLANHPCCEMCEREGRITSADLVDHIIELQDGGERLSEDNAMSMCLKCHAMKTARERQHRRAGRDSNRVVSEKKS
jgi:5-methylcytosine-specific restriction enzyme A